MRFQIEEGADPLSLQQPSGDPACWSRLGRHRFEYRPRGVMRFTVGFHTPGLAEITFPSGARAAVRIDRPH
jgi:hypothetical protein